MTGRSADQALGFRGRLGFATVDITPPVGVATRNWAAAPVQIASSVHAPLTATCMAVRREDGGNMLMFALDLGWWRTMADAQWLSAELRGALGIPESDLIVALTHTHAGPLLCRTSAAEPGTQIAEDWLANLPALLVQTARNAMRNARRCTMTWRYGCCSLAAVRDQQWPETGQWVIGWDVDSTPDTTLLVGRVTDERQRTVAVVVNYACHPTTLGPENTSLSPDFVGQMRAVVRRHAHTRHVLYLQGASGDLAPPNQYVSDTSVADRNGRELGHAVCATIEAMGAPGTDLARDRVVESGASLGIWRRTGTEHSHAIRSEQIGVSLLLKADLPERQALVRGIARAAGVERERLTRLLGVRASVGDGRSARIPIWCWRLGDAVLLAHPNEAYSAAQIRLRRQYPANAVIVANVANGHIGYLPPRDRYADSLYSVKQTPFAAGSLERVSLAAGRAFDRLLRPS